jgi:hypothetical protein
VQGNDEWDEVVLRALIGSVDMHSIHFYTTLGQEKVKEVKGYEYENNVFGPAVSYFPSWWDDAESPRPQNAVYSCVKE